MNALISSLCVLAFLATASAPAAAYKSGNELLRDCSLAVKVANGDEHVDSYGPTACVHYLNGLNDGVTLVGVANSKREGFDRIFCIGKDVQNGQVIRVVVKGLQDHPSMLHMDAAMLAGLALRDAFPCPHD